MMAEALRMKRGLEMPSLVVESLCRFAETFVVGGRVETAARLVGATQALREEIGGGFFWVAEAIDETLAKLRTDLDAETLSRALEHGRRLTADEAIELALALTRGREAAAGGIARARSPEP